MKNFFRTLNTPIGKIGLVWSLARSPRIEKIFLPGGNVERIIKMEFPTAEKEDVDTSGEELCTSILKWFSGRDWRFGSSRLNPARCYSFQKKVLAEACMIPRGKVMAYGALAKQVGFPRAARAVGTALGCNPFPLLIPCHRIVRSDGSLGGFGGGLPMKRKLLEMEGIVFDSRNRVRMEHMHLPVKKEGQRYA